jgi:hypothetical protein
MVYLCPSAFSIFPDLLSVTVLLNLVLPRMEIKKGIQLKAKSLIVFLW